MKKLLIGLSLALAIPASVLASPVSWDGNFGTQILQPLQSFWGAQIKGSYFTATSTILVSTFPFASTSILSANSLCLTGDLPCKTLWPTGGGYDWIFSGTSAITPSTTVGIIISASSTIGSSMQTGGLTISGGSTTTLNAYFANRVGIGTVNPQYSLHIAGNTGTQLLIDVANDTDTQGPNIFTTRSRGTLASPTIVVSGDELLQLETFGYAGGPNINAGGISMFVDATPSAIDMPSRLEFKTVPDGSALSLVRMVIKNSGFVGIGTSTPAKTLSVQGNGLFSGDVSVAGLTATGTVQFTALTNGALAATSNGTLYTFSTSTWSFASSTLLGDNNRFTGGNVFFASTTIGGGGTSNGLTVNGTATTTNLIVTALNAANCDVKADINGLLSCGTDAGAYPFALTGNATSTLTQFNGGLTAYASSTIGDGSQIGGLTVSGGATTTGTAYFANTVGIGASTPSALLQVTNTTASPSFLVEDSASPDTTPFLITAAGQVVIGSSSPMVANVGFLAAVNTNMTAATGATKVVMARLDTGSGMFFGAGTLGDYVTFHNTKPLFIGSDSYANIILNGNVSTQNTFLTVDTTGETGVGTTSPWGKLSVHKGTADTAKGPSFVVASSTASATTTQFIVRNNGFTGVSTTTPWRTFAVNGTVGMEGLTTSSSLQSGDLCISANSEVINDSILCVASAKRYKQDIHTLSNQEALDTILKLHPVSFFYKPEYNGALQSDPNYSSEWVGLIADDVQKVDPRLVTVETGVTTFEGKEYPAGTVRGVKYEQLVAPLIGAIQEQQQEIYLLKKSTSSFPKNFTDQWQWIAIGLLTISNLYLLIKYRYK